MPKRDLQFSKPLMNAAGTLGFAPDFRAPVDWAAFGAFVTNPISMRHRRPAQHPALISYSGGFLLHTGLPNPGFKTVVERNARGWRDSTLPIIVNLMADRPDEARLMVQSLEGLDNVLAVELGFAPLLADDIIALAVEASLGELPIIVSLPAQQFLRLGPRLLDMGVSALSMSSPRGALIAEHGAVGGRLFGPSLLPQSLELVRSASLAGLTVIAGGVSGQEDSGMLLDAGAAAVQIDFSLWLPTTNKRSPVN